MKNDTLILKWYKLIRRIETDAVSYDCFARQICLFVLSMQTGSQKNNILQVGLYLQAGRLREDYDRRWVHSSSVGNGTLMHITDITNDSGSSAQSGWRWSGLPGRAGSKAGLMVRCLFYSVRKKMAVFTWSRTESGPSQLTGGIQNTVSQEGTLKRKKAAVHKWVKPRVWVLLGIISSLLCPAAVESRIKYFRLATIK